MAIGLDLGSRSVKGVWWRNGAIEASFTTDTVPFLTQAIRDNRIDRGRLDLPSQALEEPIVATGYGRQRLAGVSAITEIRAHFKGAAAQTGLTDFTLVEVGGQDTKVLQVKGGRVFDFQTNDKCAAGTGRYLENMARLLGIDLAELSAARAEPVRITNTCATFGESEIIGHVVEGRPLAEIMAGLNDSVARRIVQMIKRYRPERVVFCGGVALNHGVVERLADLLGVEVIVPAQPRLNGAIGCALEAG